MKTFTQLTSLFTNLSNNTSTDNTTLAGQLINDQHRYLIEKYFDNERTVTTATIGGDDYTLTGSLSIGAVSAALTAVWAYPTNSQLVNFSSGEQREALFTYNSVAITWGVALTETATTAISTVGVQGYTIPANISKVKDVTVTVGQLRYTPKEIQTRIEWDLINTLPYTSDIPNYFFVYGGKINIFPIPSTTGNVITFNYKTRVADLSFSDYSTGNIASAGMVAGSTTVTGLLTSWSTTAGYPTGIDIGYYNLNIKANTPYGDGIWYPISSFTSNTVLTLSNPVVNAPNITASTTYTIGQLPLLSEDFQDMLVYGALMVYFTSIVKDVDKYKMYASLYEDRKNMLEDYAGTKTALTVDLGTEPQMINGNLFLYAN